MTRDGYARLVSTDCRVVVLNCAELATHSYLYRFNFHAYDRSIIMAGDDRYITTGRCR